MMSPCPSVYPTIGSSVVRQPLIRTLRCAKSYAGLMCRWLMGSALTPFFHTQQLELGIAKPDLGHNTTSCIAWICRTLYHSHLRTHSQLYKGRHR